MVWNKTINGLAVSILSSGDWGRPPWKDDIWAEIWIWGGDYLHGYKGTVLYINREIPIEPLTFPVAWR